MACSGDVRESTATHETDDTDDTPPDDSATFEGCHKLEIGYDGPDEPHVGDAWDLQLWCDEALMTVVIIRFDPADFARVQDSQATFLYAGTAELTMQTGSQRAYLDITVLK